MPRIFPPSLCYILTLTFNIPFHSAGRNRTFQTPYFECKLELLWLWCWFFWHSSIPIPIPNPAKKWTLTDWRFVSIQTRHFNSFLHIVIVAHNCLHIGPVGDGKLDISSTGLFIHTWNYNSSSVKTKVWFSIFTSFSTALPFPSIKFKVNPAPRLLVSQERGKVRVC